MRLCISGLLFLLLISLPSGNGLFGNDGVELRTCTALKGRCFFGCRVGWTWVAFCHNILSCCTKMKKNLPPQVKDPWVN
uniref:Defensin beta 136 n=2 Tax=Canis lupus familiaris TaxID=9615 RepID=A0A8C0TIB3_CANLF